MKTLDLDAFLREYLFATCALARDDEGNETLVGLTRAEAIEFLLVMAAPRIEEILRKFDDPMRFFYLYDRHTMALNPGPSLLDGWIG